MATYNADVVIWGSTMPGILAGVAAARQGRTVALVSDRAFGGGMSRHGLSAFDFGPSGMKDSVLGGLTRSAFLDRLDQIFGNPVGTLTMTPEPRRVTTVVTELLATTGLTAYNSKTFGSVTKSGSRIASLTAAGSGDVWNGQVFIDASYEADLAAAAGVTCSYSREARTTYGEDGDGGSNIAGWGSRYQAQGVPVLDANGQRIYSTNPMPRTDIQGGDAVVSPQTFNFRVVLTNTASKLRAVQQPAGYKASDYQIFLNFLNSSAGAGITKLVGSTSSSDAVLGGVQLQTLDGANKWDCNRLATVTSNFYQSGYGKAAIQAAYITGDKATRDAIKTDHYRWVCGLIYFIQNDASVAAARPALQTDAQTYAFCNDEFSSNFFGQAGFPYEMYVRECRRIVGQYVMKQGDVTGGGRVRDPIARWGYSVDRHGALRYPRPGFEATNWMNEGGFNMGNSGDYYEIPWRALLPCEGQADNLAVAWGVSASSIAFGSIRMELAGMLMGEAAGLAAHLALADGVDVVRLPYARLRPALLAQGALI